MTGREPAQEIDRPAGASHPAADRGETIAFLAEPASYGPDIKRIERFAIHGAMVLLAGTRAYYIRRAVRHPYVDFSTLALCAAPELYLGVEAVKRHQKFRWSYGPIKPPSPP